jgi:hypothetical protein
MVALRKVRGGLLATAEMLIFETDGLALFHIATSRQINARLRHALSITRSFSVLQDTDIARRTK